MIKEIIPTMEGIRNLPIRKRIIIVSIVHISYFIFLITKIILFSDISKLFINNLYIFFIYERLIKY